MKKNWIITCVPFLFKLGPDSEYYLWFKKIITFKSIDGLVKVYCFINNKTYINTDDFYIDINRLKNDISRKIEKIKILEQKNDELNTKISECLNYKIDTDNKISNLNNNIIHLDNIIEIKEKNNKDIKELFYNEIQKKDTFIESLRILINHEREKSENERFKIEEQHSNNIGMLRKQIEYLDNDFVDVAKAMKIFNCRESKPLKGFRIKLD